MAITHAELMARRKIVRAFIQADAIKVAFRRKIKVDMGAGGYKYQDGPPLPPQTMRMIRGKRRFGSSTVNTEGGDVTRYPYYALMYYNADVEVGDVFAYEDELYKVDSLEPDRQERTVIWLIHYGAGDVATL